MEHHKNPPTPRLFPGQILRETLEIGVLFHADTQKNCYEALLDGQSVLLLECHGDLDLIDIDNSIQPYTPFCHEQFSENGRHYLIYGTMPGTPYDAWHPMTREEELAPMLFDMLAMVDALTQGGIDLAHVRLHDCYFDEEAVGVLLLPIAVAGDVTVSRADWIRQFVRDLCFRKLERKTTRNLERPLACLHLSAGFELALEAFMDGDGLDSFRNAIRMRVQASLLDPDIAGDTHVGMVRDHNEDAFASFSYRAANYQGRADQHFLAVSDGMGGHARGEVASQKTLDHWQRLFLAQTLLTDAPESNPLWVKTTREIYDLVASRLNSDRDLRQGVSTLNNPGATLVSATVSGRLAFVANTGDSRAYLIAGGKAVRLSRDHSLVQLYLDRGQITASEAQDHEHSNVITSYMGIETKLFRQYTSVTWVPPGARLLLCSDGLTDMLDEATIAAIASQNMTASEIVAELIDAANEAGGNDNITVLLLKDRAPSQTEHDGDITLDLDLEEVPSEEDPESERDNGVQHV